MKRDFKEWLSTFRPCIADYCYYVDFDKVNKNVDDIK
ncbi:TPA: restriction endonuclease, partial [Candidatus Scatousia excrementigallinarum]|nr:restriction endonuclease [Candidatus Scatousia excrementigallinarum]